MKIGTHIHGVWWMNPNEWSTWLFLLKLNKNSGIFKPGVYIQHFGVHIIDSHQKFRESVLYIASTASCTTAAVAAV